MVGIGRMRPVAILFIIVGLRAVFRPVAPAVVRCDALPSASASSTITHLVPTSKLTDEEVTTQIAMQRMIYFTLGLLVAAAKGTETAGGGRSKEVELAGGRDRGSSDAGRCLGGAGWVLGQAGRGMWWGAVFEWLPLTRSACEQAVCHHEEDARFGVSNGQAAGLKPKVTRA